MTRLFTTGERDQAVRTLVRALRADARVDNLDLFGSVAGGSADRHSDVDLGVIVTDDVPVPTVAEEWAQRVRELLPVFHMFSESFGRVELRGFLLENFLEIDLAFSHAADWTADPEPRPADVAARYLSKTDFIWHDVLHGAVAVDRGRPWRALFYIERLRHGAIELASLRLGLDSRHHKQADELPAELRDDLETTLTGSLDPHDLRAALRAATRAFFAEARTLQPELAERLEPRLLTLLDLIDSAPGTEVR
jgi:predicted nucleotidyltransferase